MKLLICITGASGVVYGKRLLEVLSKKEDITSHLVISESARELIDTELNISSEDLEKIADDYFGPSEMGAPPASGSSLYDGVLIVPCSMSTLSKISTGIADNLITRSAAVALKEGRELILVPRETPLSTINLKHMKNASAAGACILPASPAFYSNPQNIEDLVDFIVGKIIDRLGIENELFYRWGI